MKNEYIELSKKRDYYARCVIQNKSELVPAEELSRAKEVAAELERGYSVMFSEHSGAPGPDCPF